MIFQSCKIALLSLIFVAVIAALPIPVRRLCRSTLHVCFTDNYLLRQSGESALAARGGGGGGGGGPDWKRDGLGFIRRRIGRSLEGW
jgi:hypothetical protein